MQQEFHTGGCHCGNVRFRARLDLSQIIACNCSICAKKGAWLTLVKEEDFVLLSGEEYLKDYLFHKKVIHHLFCTECGVQAFSRGALPDGTPVRMVNVRCLDSIDIHTLTPAPYEDKNL
jgi:hypothetical protein